MPEEVGNEANHGFEKQAPSIDLGINLVATQWTEENDSFDDQYDKDAKYPEVNGGNEEWYKEGENTLTVSTAAHLVDFAKRVNEGNTFEGKTITLANDIALDGVSNWAPIGTWDNPFKGEFDGAGHTVSQFFFDQTTATEINVAGFFGNINGATIKNLTVDGSLKATAYAEKTYSCGGICGYSMGTSKIENCVNKVTIDGTSIANDENALLALGGILGTSAANSGNSVTISQCTNEGAIVCGNAESLGGCVAGGITAITGEGITVTNCTGNAEVTSNNSETTFVDKVAVAG